MLQQYVKWELPDEEAGIRKGRGTRDQSANILWIIEKTREFQKNVYFCFIDYAKAFDCVDHNKLWKLLKEMEIQDHLTCILRNLCTDQKATVRTSHGTMNWFKIGKGIHQGCTLSLCLFNSHAEYIMRHARLDESHTGIKIAKRNINKLRCARDTTLMAENKEELKSLLIKVKETEVWSDWFTWETNKVRDTELALTTKAAGALSNSWRCPTLSTFLSGS